MLNKNKREFWYASYLGKEPRTDKQGNKTGEWDYNYSIPVKCSANVSAAKGKAHIRMFGESLDYDRVIAFEKPCPIDEYSQIWLDALPVETEVPPHDYVVVRIADSLNYVNAAIRKTNVAKEGAP